MRIRTQTILVIAPIFAVLGIVIGLVVFASERAEVMWEVREEAASVAVSLAEFTAAGNAELVGTTPTRRNRALRNRINPLLPLGQIRRARLYLLAGFFPTPVADTARQNGAPGPLPHLVEVGAALEFGSYVSPVQDGVILSRQLRGLAPVRTREGVVVGLLEVFVNAEGLDEHSEQMMGHCLTLGGALFAVGLVLSIGISGFLTRRLSKLEKAARIVASGDYDHKIEPQGIREINDLGSTFNTMSSVMRDMVGKAKKALVDAEQYRNTGDLAATFRELDSPVTRCRIGQSEILFGNAGQTTSGTFTGMVERGEATFFLIGAVDETDSLEATIQANAVFHFMANLLKTQSPAVCLQRAGDLFKLGDCAIVEHRRGEVLTGFQAGEGFLPATEIDCRKMAPLVITTAPGLVAEKIRRLLQSTGTLTRRELDLLMEGQPLAGFLIIQRARTDGPSNPAAGPARYRNQRAVLRVFR